MSSCDSRPRELGVPVAEQEVQASSSLFQDQQEVAGLLGEQAPLGLAVTPARWTRRVSCSMKNSTYSRRSQIVSTAKTADAPSAPDATGKVSRSGLASVVDSAWPRALAG
jgi:hypothetical protein